MSYPGHNPTRPRSVLVIVGGMLAWAGLWGGVLIATPEYHRTLTMKEEPVEMTWQQLVDEGLTDNSYVRLVDVQLNRNNPMESLDNVLAQFDPTLPAEEQREALEMAAENFDFEEFADMVIQPVKVYPQDQQAENVPARVIVPQTAWAIQAAYEEVEARGTLTGRFTLTERTRMETEFTRFLIGLDAVQQASELDEDKAEENQAEPVQAEYDGPQWTFEPVHGVPNTAEAAQWFWLSWMAVAVGLVICGAGGPSLVCCIFFQAPSILSVLGFPMRYGRAGNTTRVVYAAIGIGLIVYGYKKMMIEGRFGQLDGDIALAALGYIAGSVGSAALLGSITNVVAARLNLSLEPKPSKKQQAEPTISFTQACSLEPGEDEMLRNYVDPSAETISDHRIPDSLRSIAEQLVPLNFADPEPVGWSAGEYIRPALIQLGCQNMVVVDADGDDGTVTTRMVSVLHDGLTVVTLSPNVPSQKPLRFGTRGLYLVNDSADPMDMLSAHLEQTVSMAEKRNTSVVILAEDETVDVALLGRRALADVRTQYGEEKFEVDAFQYGRFRFPPAPVADRPVYDEAGVPVGAD